MSIIKKGNQTMETREEQESYYCECCHCKKIFMLLVLLILAFIAGIMVGNCQSRTSYSPYGYIPTTSAHTIVKPMHRGALQPHANTNQPATNQPNPNAQVSGYILEIEQSK